RDHRRVVPAITRGRQPCRTSDDDRRWSARRAYVFVEPGDGPLPRLVGRRLVVALRRRVVVEAVYCVWIDVTLVGHMCSLQRGLVLGPRVHQALVLAAV